MIQRIQSLYLLFAALALILLFFIPYAGVIPELSELPQQMLKEQSTTVNLKIQDHTLSMVLTILPIISSFIAIFLFENRPLQAKLCLANLVMISALLIALIGLIYQYEKNFFNRHLENFDLGLLLPIIAMILTYLAYRGIRHDEELVRSADRFW